MKENFAWQPVGNYAVNLPYCLAPDVHEAVLVVERQDRDHLLQHGRFVSLSCSGSGCCGRKSAGPGSFLLLALVISLLRNLQQ
ncbi:hypothetical protein MLD38_005764 [Melastoma candidum]|uniref:Uncharacterized protein n=1 Tax=Melastoma candidum TaxID=119954 RepID=A0ACB9RKG4_9MYRT|nr:hypothetical protein MLD38_005764 [Melastoma candidum]